MSLPEKEEIAQISLEDISSDTAVSEKTNNIYSNGDAFGCCHRYRECSQSGRCVSGDVEWAKKCQYKANLESGRIFYGKNAETFNRENYEYLISYYQGLSDECKDAFKEIIYHICIKKRGVRRILCLYNTALHKILAECRLFSIDKPSTLILTLYGYQILMLKSSELFHSCYSSLPAPDFSDIMPPENMKDKDEQRKYIAKQKLKRWRQHFMYTDVGLHPEFARRFISFDVNDYMVIDEFFHDFPLSVTGEGKYLCVFDSKNLNTFKNAVYDLFGEKAMSIKNQIIEVLRAGDAFQSDIMRNYEKDEILIKEIINSLCESGVIEKNKNGCTYLLHYIANKEEQKQS